MSTGRIIHFPDRVAGGVQGWWWPEDDKETWGFILDDWETTHRDTIIGLMQRFDKSFNSVIQAGGNCGMYPVLLGQMFKKVYTFEPDPLNFFALGLNCLAENIIKNQAALGSEPGFVVIHRLTMDNVGMHRVAQHPQASVPQYTLDSIPYHDVDLIWLDIELYELNAIKGATNTILRNKPILMLENGNQAIADHLLENFGYKKIGESYMDSIYYHESI